MRYALLLLLLPTLLATGCSIYLAQAGKELTPIRTRKDAHAEFGPPITQGVEDGLQFEEFRTRRKVAEKFRGSTHSMALGMTLFLYEFYLFPRELYFLAKCGLAGQTVRMIYNPDRTVRGFSVDGRWGGVVNRMADERPSPDVPAPLPVDHLTPTVHRLLEQR
jgi:hypothetical protein